MNSQSAKVIRQAAMVVSKERHEAFRSVYKRMKRDYKKLTKDDKQKIARTQ